MKYIGGIVIALFLSACSTLKVQSDYNPEFDFSKLQTFALIHKDKAGDDTLKNDRIVHAIRRNLAAKHYTEASREEADFYVLFHTDIQSKTQIDTDYEFVGLYPYGYYGYFPMMAVPTTRVSTYEEAQIIVDIVRPQGNKIIWRATATDRLKSFKTPQERIGYINRAIDAMLEDFASRAIQPKEMP